MDGGEVDETRGGPDESDERLDGLRVLAGLAVRPPGMLRGIIVGEEMPRRPNKGDRAGASEGGRGARELLSTRRVSQCVSSFESSCSELTTRASSGGTNSVARRGALL